MPTDHRERLAHIRRFDQLVAYLRDELGWPIDSDDFEELTFEYTPEELGIDSKNAAKIQEIKRLRPLVPGQPWGIFFVKFEPKRLPVVALRRILGQVALKKRASANKSERQAWAADDLLFVSNYGEGEERRIAFAHFSKPQDDNDLPTLKVLGWDNLDTPLHLDAVARELTDHLTWPDDEGDPDAWRERWRERWRAAFTLRHREVISTSKQLSERLAELARTIRDRIRTALAIETESGPLNQLMKAFQIALVHDLDQARFADMYAQTIAYGLLSSRITDPARRTADDFAAHMRTNPFLRELLQTFLRVGGRRGKAGGPGIDFDELGVSEVVELLDQANMGAVVGDFGDRNPLEDPVIHFYEHFLAAYDKKQKVSRGVFYTPRPVVSYIVRSVDEFLRSEFGLKDGLADTTTWGEMVKRHEHLKLPYGTLPDQAFVQILDPATGTGTFLVEVIDLIHKTMVEKWKTQEHSETKIHALWNEYVPKHLLSRLHGYELQMAPYAIAHLKVGLKLHETGYRLGSIERANVFLTHALEPARDGREQIELPYLAQALAHEAEAADMAKRSVRFTVVLGNPPYSGRSWNLTPELRRLVEPYRYIAGRKIQEKGALQLEKSIQEDYIKFFRLAQTCVDRSGVGLVGLVTSHGFLDNPTLRGMRYSLIHSFDHIQVLDLHGNVSRRERAPDGSHDDNVFDIKRTGAAITVLVRSLTAPAPSVVRVGDLWGSRAHKYPWLLANTTSSSSSAHSVGAEVRPAPPHWLFVVQDLSARDEYERGVSVAEALPLHSKGVVTGRDAFVTDFDENALLARMKDFVDTSNSDAELVERYNLNPSDWWDVSKARLRMPPVETHRHYVRRMLYRPFDFRHCFYHPAVLMSPRRPVMKHVRADNFLLVTSRMTKGESFAHVIVARGLAEAILLSSKTSNNAIVFPLYLITQEQEDQQSQLEAERHAAFSKIFLSMIVHTTSLLTLLPEGKGDLKTSVGPDDLFDYIVSILHAPGYRRRYEEFLKRDFPRIPLTSELGLFERLVQAGGELSQLHLMESPKLGRLITAYEGPSGPDVGRVGWIDGTVWLDAGKTNARKGHRATTPGTMGFKGVPEEVWDFHIGGYQVCHKWLKDRKGRTLSDEDIAHYQKIVVTLNETIRIMAEIDEVIEAHGGWPDAFQTGSEANAASEGTAKVVPFRPRTVEPAPEDRYVTCVPLVPLKVAAGGFSDPQHVEDDDFEWVAVSSRHPLRKGMFVAQVVGKSMEPAILDGAWCLFRAPVGGTRQGKIVLVQLRDATDPETGQRYTVKRYKSEKTNEGDSWRHEKITLKPVNPDFEPIVLAGADEGELQVIAELVNVLGD